MTNLRSLSFSDIVNMRLLGDESFYECKTVDAEFERMDGEIERLRNKVAALTIVAYGTPENPKSPVEPGGERPAPPPPPLPPPMRMIKEGVRIVEPPQAGFSGEWKLGDIKPLCSVCGLSVHNSTPFHSRWVVVHGVQAVEHVHAACLHQNRRGES